MTGHSPMSVLLWTRPRNPDSVGLLYLKVKLWQSNVFNSLLIWAVMIIFRRLSLKRTSQVQPRTLPEHRPNPKWSNFEFTKINLPDLNFEISKKGQNIMEMDFINYTSQGCSDYQQVHPNPVHVRPASWCF